MHAVASSISGYWTEIGSPQSRHRARRSSHEITGTLSYQTSLRPHRGQRDGGLTTDCFGSAPQRSTQTFRKLPMRAPNNPAKAMYIVVTDRSAGTSDLV